MEQYVAILLFTATHPYGKYILDKVGFKCSLFVVPIQCITQLKILPISHPDSICYSVIL